MSVSLIQTLHTSNSFDQVSWWLTAAQRRLGECSRRALIGLEIVFVTFYTWLQTFSDGYHNSVSDQRLAEICLT